MRSHLGPVIASCVTIGLGFGGHAAEPVPWTTIKKVSTGLQIDGKLDDDVWESATIMSDLKRHYPIPRSQPSEPTEIRICYDERRLYVSFRCFDSQPEKISAFVMQYDQRAARDDFAAILLDPYNTGRDGFLFPAQRQWRVLKELRAYRRS